MATDTTGLFDLDQLHCYGCAHSAGSAPFPGAPSGERPCQFCIRNAQREDPPVLDCWYNGSPPVKLPMDCYHTIDMKDQIWQWEQQPDNRIVNAKEVTTVHVIDPDTKMYVHVCIFKEEGGGMGGVDASYLEQDVDAVVSPHNNGRIQWDDDDKPNSAAAESGCGTGRTRA